MSTLEPTIFEPATPLVIRVRDAVIADAPDVIDGNAKMALETEGLTLDHATLSAGVRAALLDSAKARYWVAETPVDGELKFAGQLMITHEWSDWRNGDIWWIQSVYTVPAFRRRGVFKALYAHVRALAQCEKAVGLRLYVEENNATGQNTYKTMGMIRTHYGIMEEMFNG